MVQSLRSAFSYLGVRGAKKTRVIVASRTRRHTKVECTQRINVKEKARVQSYFTLTLSISAEKRRLEPARRYKIERATLL